MGWLMPLPIGGVWLRHRGAVAIEASLQLSEEELVGQLKGFALFGRALDRLHGEVLIDDLEREGARVSTD